jgi:hypothetical protein
MRSREFKDDTTHAWFGIARQQNTSLNVVCSTQPAILLDTKTIFGAKQAT